MNIVVSINAVFHVYCPIMVKREIQPHLEHLFRQYPFVTITGPRQSGKTTLCRATFPNLKYVDLDDPEQREFAMYDPRGFLSGLGNGAILDEIQRVPKLLSYLKVLADEIRQNSLFVLTGSQQFALSDKISQSLAGRTALLCLLPFSLFERNQANANQDIDNILLSGFYPRIHSENTDPRQTLADYFETYVQRDVRQITEIRNLSSYQRFVRLCAGRIGQLTNHTSLGSDAGVTHTTAKHWLTVLEASYIVFQLPPYFANIRKQLVKSSKLYFYDVGLASYLLGIRDAEQMAYHLLRGALFENAVIVEALKHLFNKGERSNLSFYRDSKGLKCDLLFEYGLDIGAIEIKAGSTIARDWFKNLNRISELLPQVSSKTVIYGDNQKQFRNDGNIATLSDIGEVLDYFENHKSRC